MKKITEYIFRRVFYKALIQLEFKSLEAELILDENISMNRFKETFTGIDFQNENDVMKVLTTKHPSYNGKDKEKLEL